MQIGDEDIILKFTYRGQSADEPWSHLSRKFMIDLNIIFGDIDVLQDKLLGGLIVVASGPRDKLNEAVLYLIEQEVHVEVIYDAKHPVC